MIKDMAAGVWSAGTWIKQVELEERYKVSRALVRRVLDDLTARDYLRHLPNCGYRVAKATAQERLDLREVRAALEVYAAAGVVERVEETDFALLRRLAEAFHDAVRFGDASEQARANLAFHEAFFATEQNALLREMLAELRRKAAARVLEPWHSLEEMLRASREHFEMVDLLEQRDLSGLQAVIAAHITFRVIPLEPSEA